VALEREAVHVPGAGSFAMMKVVELLEKYEISASVG
jgi:hypothetical protein